MIIASQWLHDTTLKIRGILQYNTQELSYKYLGLDFWYHCLLNLHLNVEIVIRGKHEEDSDYDIKVCIHRRNFNMAKYL